MAQLTTVGRTAVLTCDSQAEAEVIRIAVNRYSRYLRSIGEDTRDWAVPNSDGPGFGWDAVCRVAGDLHAGSTVYMSRRMAEAIRQALSHAAGGRADDGTRAVAEAARRISTQLAPSHA